MRAKFAWLSIAVVIWLAAGRWPLPDPPACQFIAMDVGQGDAILIQTPDGQDVLIDGGPSAAVVNELGKYLPAGDRDLELVILTHPDSDHINGLVPVLERFTVKQIFTSEVQTNTAIFAAWTEAVNQRQIPVRYVVQGEQFSLGNHLTFTVLWPLPGDEWKIGGGGTPTNEASVSIHLTCAGSTAVLTGDASDQVEDRILRSGLPVQASLFKAGHHGSKSSNAHAWLTAVQPDLVVISVGADNRYNHPHPASMLRFETAGIEVLRTDLIGGIRLRSTGSGSWEIDT